MKIVDFNELQIGGILGTGGEGIVYSLKGSNEVYKEFKNCDIDKIKKIERLIGKNIKNKFIALPSTLVKKDNIVVGYLMPKVEGFEFSKSLTAPRQLFERKLIEYTRADLLAIAQDFLKKVDLLHKKNILIGDINPNNFMLDVEKREVYFIDCDSYQVDDLPCPVGTPEFTPAELQGIDFRKQCRTIENELFSVGILLFTMLMPGQKPYAGKVNSEEEGDVKTNIKNQNFPYPLGLEHNYKEPQGRWDIIWRQFDLGLKEAFYNTFKLGKRINIETWIDILDKSEKELLDTEIFPSEDKRILTDANSDWLGRAGMGDMRKTILKNMREKESKVAIIELSTKAVKLLIRNDMEDKEFSFEDFAIQNGGYREGVLTKTGKGVKADGNMDMFYFEKNVSPTIEKFVNKAIKVYKVKHIYCVATAAIRSSKNKKDILNYLENKFSIKCQILSKDEEAVLTTKAFRYTALANDNGKRFLDGHENKNIAYIDQGGGSTEFALFNNLDKNPTFSKSLNLGTTTLENAIYINSNQDTTLEKAFELIDRETDKRLKNLFQELKNTKLDGIIAVGTAITKASGKKGNKHQHCHELSLARMEDILLNTRRELISVYSTVGRLKIAQEDKSLENNLDSKLSMALGLKTYIDILKHYSANKLIISGTGLWYGIFYKAFEEIVLNKEHLAV